MSASVTEDGSVEAMYLLFSDAPVEITKEIDGDGLLADYDKDGELVGIEVLVPVSIASLLDLLEESSRRDALARFLRRHGPQELVRA